MYLRTYFSWTAYVQPFRGPAYNLFMDIRTTFSCTCVQPFHGPPYSLFMDDGSWTCYSLFMDLLRPFHGLTYTLFIYLRTAFSYTCVQPFHGPTCTLFMDLRTGFSWTCVQPFHGLTYSLFMDLRTPFLYLRTIFFFIDDRSWTSIQPFRGHVYSLFTDDGSWTFMDNRSALLTLCLPPVSFIVSLLLGFQRFTVAGKFSTDLLRNTPFWLYICVSFF